MTTERAKLLPSLGSLEEGAIRGHRGVCDSLRDAVRQFWKRVAIDF